MPTLKRVSILSILFLGLLMLTMAKRDRPSHSCIHDDLDITFDHVDVPHEKDSNGRMLSSYSNIRIYFDTSNIDSLDAALVSYVKNILIPPAKAYFEKTLKVVPLSQNLNFPGYTSVCDGTVPLPSLLEGTGVAADMVIMITATNDASDNYIAYASACALAGDTNRPVLGNLNYNLAYVSATTDDADIESDMVVTMHELTHAMGFSSGLYSYYIDPSTNNVLSSPKTTKTVNGNTINILTLSTLTAKVKSYFGCSSATGAYLENQGGSGSAGSHWERRVFNNEYMTASAIEDLRVSEFTLALLEGTGWYQVDYSMAEAMTWGKGEGCNFLDTKCVDTSTKLPAFDEFCNIGSKGCSWTGRGFSICNSGTSSSSVTSSFNYWANNTVTWDSFADNCPTWQIYSNKDCEDSYYQSTTTLPNQEYYGYGSKCFTGTLNTYPSYMSSTWGYCFKPTCYQVGSNYIVEVAIGTTKVNCTSQSQQSVSGFGGYLQCPDPTDFCTRIEAEGKCRRGCFGRGTCVDNTCVCDTGYSGFDCSRGNTTSTEEKSNTKTIIIAVVAGVGGVLVIGAVFVFVKKFVLAKKARSVRAPRSQPQQQYVVSPPQTANVHQNNIYNGYPGAQYGQNSYQNSHRSNPYTGAQFNQNPYAPSQNAYAPQYPNQANAQTSNGYYDNYRGYGNRI